MSASGNSHFDGCIETADTATGHAEIGRLARIIWREHYTPIIGPEQVEYMLERGYTPAALAAEQDAGARLLIARDAHQTLGFSGWTPDAQDAASAWLDRLYVLKEARGRGVARALVTRVCEDVAGCSMLRLRVNRDNVQSIAAYERLGFAVERTDIKTIGDGFVMDDYIMCMAL